MRKPYQWSGNAVVVNFIPLSGLAGDEPFTFEFAEDGVELVTGVDGEGMFVLHETAHGEGTIRVEWGSSANVVMEAIYAAKVPVTLLAKDNSTGTTLASPEMMVKKKPAFTLGKTVKEVEWVFLAKKVKQAHGVSGEV